MNIKLNHYVANIIGILLTITLIASGCTPAATPSPTAILPTPTPDLIGLVNAYEEAVNRHDLDATMAMFADKSMYQWGDWKSALAKQDISDLHNFFFETNEDVQNTGCTVEGFVVKCQAVFRSDCTVSAGMEGEHFTFVEYTFENGKIRLVRAIGLREDHVTLDNFYTSLLDWGSKNYQEEYSKLNSGGAFLFNQETGNIMSMLCKEFDAAKP